MANTNSDLGNSNGDGGGNQRKSSVPEPQTVSGSTVPLNTLNGPTQTDANNGVPPPYADLSPNNTNSSVDDKTDSPDVSQTYTVPKDLSEGLSNPVFKYTPENPDDDYHNQSTTKTDSPVHINKLLIPPTASATESFTSLSSFDAHYASQTTLYHKDHHIGDVDSEKGSTTKTTKDNNNEDKAEKKEYVGFKRYLGMALTLSASFSFSIVVLFVKLLQPYGFEAYGSSFWRYTGTVVPTIPLLFFYEYGPGTKKQSSVFNSVWPVFENQNWKTWLGLLSRGLIGSTSVILRYYALQYLTIGDTSVITYSTPVLVTVLAHFFLGERCGVFPVIVAFVTLCGVIIVTKPPILTGKTEFDSDMLIGTGLACGSLLCSALIVIITRKIREVHFTVMTLVFGIIGVAQALVLIYFLGEFDMPQGLTDSLLVAGVSGLSFLGQMAIVLALKFENAGPVALIRSCDVLFGFLFQYLFLNVIPDEFSSVGAVIVLFGVLATGFRKWLNTLPAEDRRRQTWSLILR